MSEEMKAKWDEAAATGERVSLGKTVICDQCNRDYTDSTDEGGFIFGSHAYCPKCAAESLPRIRGYGEEHYIKARCQAGQSFADFVRGYRGPDAGIEIRTFSSFEELLGMKQNEPG
jgi:hypothetical protein